MSNLSLWCEAVLALFVVLLIGVLLPPLIGFIARKFEKGDV